VWPCWKPSACAFAICRSEARIARTRALDLDDLSGDSLDSDGVEEDEEAEEA
jgi:hypothetical protein